MKEGDLMEGTRRVAITIYTILDVSDIPKQELLYDPFALQAKVDEFVKDCSKDYFEYSWKDLGEE